MGKKEPRSASQNTEQATPRKRWTAAEIKILEILIQRKTPIRLIAVKLGRSESSVYSRAADSGFSLAPTDGGQGE